MGRCELAIQSHAAGQIKSIIFIYVTAIAGRHSGRMAERKHESGAQKRKLLKLREQRDQDILKKNPKLTGYFKAAESSSSRQDPLQEDCQLASANIGAGVETPVAGSLAVAAASSSCYR